MTARLELPVNPDGGKEPTGGAPGPAGPGVPTGGIAGDGLVKTSGVNFATAWQDIATQDELDTAAQGLTLAVGTIANELGDLVAALGNPDQIAWGAEFDVAGEASTVPGGDVFAGIFNVVVNLNALMEAQVGATPLLLEFEIDAATVTPLGSVGFDTVTLLEDAFNGAVRTSTGTVDDSVVFGAATRLKADPGAWKFTLTHYTGPDCGIYTIETLAEDTVSWDVAGTIDGYAAVPAAAQTVLAGVAVSTSCDAIRVRMATKNGSSSSFVGRISALSGMFIFT